jgi:hypothetical protein
VSGFTFSNSKRDSINAVPFAVSFYYSFNSAYIDGLI